MVAFITAVSCVNEDLHTSGYENAKWITYQNYNAHASVPLQAANYVIFMNKYIWIVIL